MQLTGIILAGGKSTRMGTDKALLEINDKSLLSHTVKLCQSVCNQILISSGNAMHDVEGILRIPDVIEDCGPMGGIYSCLKHAVNDWSFVISVDAAFVTSDFVKFLSEHVENFDAVVPVHHTGKEPLIALYNKKCIEVLKGSLDLADYKMHHFLEIINTNFVDSNHWIDKYPRLFHNINSPKDLM